MSSSSVVWSASRAARGRREPARDALGLAGRRARGGAELAELLGDGGHPRVGLVQAARAHASTRCWAEVLASVAVPSSKRTRSQRWIAAASAVRASSTAAWTSSSEGCAAEPPCATPAPSEVAGAGDGHEVGCAATSGAGRGEVVDDRDAGRAATATDAAELRRGP